MEIASLVRNHLRGNKEFLDFKARLKEQTTTGHYLLIKNNNLESHIGFINEYKALADGVFKDTITNDKNGQPDLLYWNTLRFFLCEDTMNYHELDVKILIRDYVWK